MILVAILNDLVTLVLGTDRTSISHHPENWHLGKLGFISGTLAIFVLAESAGRSLG
jgi:H+-transporting ATPase